MADPFTGEIRAFAFTFPPANWSQCNGQQVLIQQNNVLYAVIGNIYGGNLQTYFNLPDLRGRVPVDAGSGPGLTPRNPGQTMGEDTVALTSVNFPAHNHQINVALPAGPSPAGLASAPSAAVIPARETTALLEFNNATSSGSMVTFSDLPAAPALAMTGQTTPPAHNNAQPYLTLNFCICQYGDFPPRP